MTLMLLHPGSWPLNEVLHCPLALWHAQAWDCVCVNVCVYMFECLDTEARRVLAGLVG